MLFVDLFVLCLLSLFFVNLQIMFFANSCEPGLATMQHEGVQYVPCVMTMDQWAVYHDSGAVPIAYVPASDVCDGVVPPDKLANLVPFFACDGSCRPEA